MPGAVLSAAGRLPGEALCEERLDEHILIVEEKHYDGQVCMSLGYFSRGRKGQRTMAVGGITAVLADVRHAPAARSIVPLVALHRLRTSGLRGQPYAPADYR